MRQIRELIGANITLTCFCDSDLDEVWTFNNSPRNTTEDGFLNIFSLSAANAGSYTCDNGNQTGNVTVIVQAISKPFQIVIFNFISFYLLPPSDVTVSPTAPTTLIYGASFSLNCLLNFQPLVGNPSYSWLLNGAVLPNANASALSIPMVTVSQGGSYSCQVRLHGVALSSPSGVLLTVTGR